MADAKGITTECEMWAHITPLLGRPDLDTPTVQYAPNGQTVTYVVKGAPPFEASFEKP
jgi:hypothetical protein